MQMFRPNLIALSTVIALAACNPVVHLGDIGDGGIVRLWSATFEPGDLSEWASDGNGGTRMANVMISPTATSEVAHKGRYAGKVTVMPATGMVSIEYFFREQPSLTEGYYSAWFYIPGSFKVNGWLSIIQFVGSRSGDGRNASAIWDVNLYPQSDGTLAAQLYDFVKVINRQQPSPIAVPIQQWVHFEVFLRKAAGPTGRIAVWQDGISIIDVNDVTTTENDWVQWNVGGASDNIAPSPGFVYVDDAAISLTRLGPGA